MNWPHIVPHCETAFWLIFMLGWILGICDFQHPLEVSGGCQVDWLLILWFNHLCICVCKNYIQLFICTRQKGYICFYSYSLCGSNIADFISWSLLHILGVWWPLVSLAALQPHSTSEGTAGPGISMLEDLDWWSTETSIQLAVAESMVCMLTW